MEEDIEGLKILFYTNALTQYGKRKLISYYEQRYKELEEENRELLEVKISASAHNRITELERENSRLYERAMIAEGNLKQVKNELRDYVYNSIPISVIQNKKKEEREKCVARFRYGNDEAPLESYKYKYTDIDMNEYAGSEIMRVLQEILEEGRR